MAKAMEKLSARRLGSPSDRQVAARGKSKTRSSEPPKSGAKMIKAITAEKKERASTRPPSVRPAADASAAVPRVEPVRLHGSEHGAAVSKTDHLKARFTSLSAATTQIKALKRSIQKNFF